MVYLRIKNLRTTKNNMTAYAYLCKTYWNGGKVKQKVVQYIGKVNELDKLDLKKISFNACVYCGSKNNLSIDHRIPLSKGGTNNSANIQVLCLDCNKKKGKSMMPKYYPISKIYRF